MKKLLIALVCLSCSAFGAYGEKLPHDENQRHNRDAELRFAAKLEVLREADAVEIRRMPEDEKRVRIKDAAAVRHAVAQLVPDFSEQVWYRGRTEDEAYSLSVPCQCWGEFEFTFFKDEAFIAKFTTVHLRGIKDEKLTDGFEERLKARALEAFYEMAAAHFDLGKELLAEIRKPNKQPQQQRP